MKHTFFNFYLKKKASRVKNIALFIIAIYLVLIAIGTLLLLCPITRVDGEIRFLDSFFTATSAISVTGLTLHDTSLTYTMFGQIIILALIQIGGLGYMTLAVTMIAIMGKNIGIQERIQFKETQGFTELDGLKKLALNMIKYAFSIEIVGVIILWIIFQCDPLTKNHNTFYLAIFHSISAFCNAGFDIFGAVFGQDMGLMPLNHNPYCLLALAMLSILGSFGYIALKDLIIPERKRKRSTQTKIVFTTTISLLFFGTVMFFLFEQSYSMKDMNWGYRLLNSFYLSATSRSTGLGNINVGELSIVAYWVLFLLEVIGGSPSGTGGGIKTTTFAVLLASVKSALTKREDTEIFGRRIPTKFVNRALSVITLYILLCFAAFIILGFTEPEIIGVPSKAVKLQLDIFSAMGTAGLSNNLHRDFSHAGLYVMIFLMFIGRVGSLTIFNSIVFNNKKIKTRYPSEDVSIG